MKKKRERKHQHKKSILFVYIRYLFLDNSKFQPLYHLCYVMLMNIFLIRLKCYFQAKRVYLRLRLFVVLMEQSLRISSSFTNFDKCFAIVYDSTLLTSTFFRFFFIYFTSLFSNNIHLNMLMILLAKILLFHYVILFLIICFYFYSNF